MQQLRIHKYLYDIKVAIDSIFDYLGPKRSFAIYEANKQLRRSVERELEIIGEAVGKILQIDPNCPIDNARQIVGLRNRVIHAYDNIDNGTIWGIVINHLPTLKRDVEKLLG